MPAFALYNVSGTGGGKGRERESARAGVCVGGRLVVLQRNLKGRSSSRQKRIIQRLLK